MVLPDFFENIPEGTEYPEELSNYIAVQKNQCAYHLLVAIEELSISSSNKEYLIKNYKGISFKGDVIGFTVRPDLEDEEIYDNKRIEQLIKKILSFLENEKTINIYIEFYDDNEEKHIGRATLADFLL